MQLQFLGATRTVTGSKYLISLDRRHVLVDCGLFQGLKELRLRNWQTLPLNPKSIDAVILTHAHIDHTGYLPLLVKNGFRGKVYVTAGTKALCEILLPDAGYLQEEDAFFANRHHFSKHDPALPLYTEADAVKSLDHLKTVPWKKPIALNRHGSFQFLPAGHILGAAMVKLNFNGTSILFSGDLGRQKSVLMRPPESVQHADYLVVESTYGDRSHPDEDPQRSLMEIVNRTIQRGGTVLIPAFAVGRVQEVLLLISQLKAERKIPNVPVYLNSPMAIEATQVVRELQKEMTLTEKQSDSLCRVAHFISTVEESKKLNVMKEPSIIISASGMATGGRVLHHLKFLAPHPKNTILFVGFQAAGTRGEALLNGSKEIKIHGEIVPVLAEVERIETLSAHADRDEILVWLRKFHRAPRLTFITHGEPPAAEALRQKIQEELHWECAIPEYSETRSLT